MTHSITPGPGTEGPQEQHLKQALLTINEVVYMDPIDYVLGWEAQRISTDNYFLDLEGRKHLVDSIPVPLALLFVTQADVDAVQPL